MLKSKLWAAVRKDSWIGDVAAACGQMALGVGVFQMFAGGAGVLPATKAGIRAPDLRKSVRISRTAGMYEDRAERRKERDGSAGSLHGVCHAGSSDAYRLRGGDRRRCSVETRCRPGSAKCSDLRAVGPRHAKV